MSAQDDELVRRYREASGQEDARPSAQVREAVRAHARMLAAAAAAPPPVAAPAAAAANQSRWKLSALAAVAVVGLTGLLMLQFERGAPEERDIAFGQRRAEAPAPAAAPVPAPMAEASLAANAVAQKPATPAPVPAKKPARAAPALEAESRPDSSAARAMAGSPSPPPPAADRALAAPSAEMRKRSAAASSGPDTSLPQSLQEAAGAGRAPEVESLVSQGIPIDARDGAGRTALMLAAMNGQTDTVQKLLALGANPALVDREGLNAAGHARQRGHARIADLIDAAR